MTKKNYKAQILQVLKYYDFFHYPLNIEEIQFNFPNLVDIMEIKIDLSDLVKEKVVFHYGPFYSLHPDKQWVENRLKGNQLAQVKLKEAYKISAFISSFPFVKAAFISGSLSKNYADEKTDMDFFIITAPKKLWIARSILHLFKKFTFLFGMQHHFCMNYFIDSEHLKIEEQNQYTAIELSTLKATEQQKGYLQQLLIQNDWLKSFLPNFVPPAKTLVPIVVNKNSWAGILFNNRLFDMINSILFSLTDWHWRRKWNRKNYPMEDYNLAFKSTPYVSKNHPDNYQKRVLEHVNNERTSG